MLFGNLLGWLFPGRKANRPGPRPAARPLTVEGLEDRRTPAAMLSIRDVAVVEGDTGTLNAVVTVSLTEPHGNSVTVNYKTEDGTATAGSDYTAVSGKLTFAKDEMSKSIMVPIKGDRLVELDEYFSVRLSNAKGAKIANGLAQVTVVDNEPRISISDASVTEGNEGTTQCTFTVSLSASYNLPVTVNYTTIDGSAADGTDYTAASGTLTFMPGQTSLPIAITVHGDRLGELNESFFVQVTTPDGYAQVSKGLGTATIISDEPQIYIADSYNYGESTMTFTVSLSAAYDKVVTVDFATADGTAIAGIDYVAASDTLTFQPGDTFKTITIQVLDPTSVPDKYFLVQLSGATTNAVIAAPSAYGYWYYDYGGYSYYDPGYGYYDYGYGYY
jgi:hypothetical protein